MFSSVFQQVVEKVCTATKYDGLSKDFANPVLDPIRIKNLYSKINIFMSSDTLKKSKINVVKHLTQTIFIYQCLLFRNFLGPVLNFLRTLMFGYGAWLVFRIRMKNVKSRQLPVECAGEGGGGSPLA